MLWLAGCAKDAATSQDVPVETAAPVETVASASEEKTPRALYDECHDRVESPEAPSECSADSDCTRTGCGSEVCTTVAAAKEVMSTCEVLPCFSVLESCGCNEGTCQWTLKSEVPARKLIPKGGGAQ